MSGLNRWQGIMVLGADAELRFTQGGQAVLNFRGACNETFKIERGETKEITTWVACTIWGKRGEALSKHLAKGTRVYVEGALRIGTYDDKDGNKRTKVEIHVRELEFMGGKSSASEGAAPSPGGGARPATKQSASTKAADPYDGYSDDEPPF